MTYDQFRRHVGEHAILSTHPRWDLLTRVLMGETGVSSGGYPYISNDSFRLFVQSIPHLFRDGQLILDWLARLDDFRETLDGFTFQESDSITRAIKVIRTMVFTASVTCLSDLWLLKQILVVHKKLGVLDVLLDGKPLHPSSYSQLQGLSEPQLAIDLQFMHARGYLKKVDSFFVISDDPKVVRSMDVVASAGPEEPLPSVQRFVSWLQGEAGAEEAEDIGRSLRFDVPVVDIESWVAGPEEVELGYRLAPLVLALRVMEVTPFLQKGASIHDVVPVLPESLERLLELAAWQEHGVVTDLGARVFERAPGPVGIIQAYWPYLQSLESRLTGQHGLAVFVRRGDNVAASQDANRKTFEAANDALDAFCRQYGYQYSVFVEHAVGQGEATRQRFERDGPRARRYIGADLEDAAIDEAEKQKEHGLLPEHMEFIRDADIGEPYRVVGFLRERGLDEEPAVMMVGNGFHEIRNQSNEKMVDVFRQYCEAGFLLIFTEESALRDIDLINTAWNTYHAGFRYVHEMSGQGLRPIWDEGESSERWGWRRCAEEAGYVILDDFSHRTRTIYPFSLPDRENPSISMTYFCVPSPLAAELGVEDAPMGS